MKAYHEDIISTTAEKLITDKFGNKINKPIDDFNHLMDAMRYAVERFINKKTISFGYNKII